MTLLSHTVSQPHGISPHIVTMHLQLEHGRSMVLITAYAQHFSQRTARRKPSTTVLSPPYVQFPSSIRSSLATLCSRRSSLSHCCMAKCFFGRHSVGRENSIGTLLLQTGAKHDAVITNSLFQMAKKYKTAWQHPRSKHWHVLDYIITRASETYLKCTSREQCRRLDAGLTADCYGPFCLYD